jgi:hypothetical protein
MMLHGLRGVLGDSCIDLPRKRVLYRDFSETSQKELHGGGFTLYTKAIQEISTRDISEVDTILYGVTCAYGITEYPTINHRFKNVWYLDGHDDPPIRKTPCFKRELYQPQSDVYPTGFGIPEYQIRELDFSIKSQLFQKTAPHAAQFQEPRDLGTRTHHIFTDENEYFKDMQCSWFGLTCKKGGWDTLRHYELIANGCLLLFRDYHLKPTLCSPQNLPCLSYSTPDDLKNIVDRLLPNGKPGHEYFMILNQQREWLMQHGTTVARARALLAVISKGVPEKKSPDADDSFLNFKPNYNAGALLS